jgi:hypothetical protein
MIRKPLDPIIAGKFTIRATMNIQNKWQIRIDDLGRSISPDEVPAIIAALSMLAREMGADVPDPVPVVEGLLAMTARVECQDEGDRAKIDAARSYLERTKL